MCSNRIYCTTLLSGLLMIKDPTCSFRSGDNRFFIHQLLSLWLFQRKVVSTSQFHPKCVCKLHEGGSLSSCAASLFPAPGTAPEVQEIPVKFINE